MFYLYLTVIVVDKYMNNLFFFLHSMYLTDFYLPSVGRLVENAFSTSPLFALSLLFFHYFRIQNVLNFYFDFAIEPLTTE